MCYAERAYMNLLPPKEAFAVADQEARRALSLNENETEAHVALGVVAYWHDWQWDAAAQSFQRAIELSPGHSTAHSWLGTLLDTLVDHEQSMRERLLAYELDPLDPWAALSVGYGYLIGGQAEQAAAEFRRALELESSTAAAMYGLGMTLVELERFDEACRTFEQGIQSGESSSTLLGFLGYAEALAGRHGKANGILERLHNEFQGQYISPYHVALVYLGLQRVDEMFSWLEKAFEERSTWMVWIGVAPEFKRVASDPRFISLLDRMSLEAGPGLREKS
jgi:Flp pilus assembly protein TadD